MTYSEALSTLKKNLAHLYSSDELLQILSLLIDVPRTKLTLQRDTVLNEVQRDRIFGAISELLSSKPIQYITGKADFFGLQFHVNEDTLIPRSETEELVDWILASHSDATSIKVLDIGTGSGCIPITLKKKRPSFSVSALDISKGALEIAKKNADFNIVEVIFSEKDILNSELEEDFDIIISNPPYIKEEEKQQMEVNVLNFEPHTALFVPNADPLLFYKRIANLATRHLNTHGFLYFEINAQYGAETAKLLKDLGFSEVEIKKDMQGKDRFVKGKWQN